MSSLEERPIPRLPLEKAKIPIRKIQWKVAEGMNKIYIGNCPPLLEFQMINILSEFGQLKSFSMCSISKT